MEHLGKDNCEQENSTLKKKDLVKDNSGKEEPENGQFQKGKTETTQFRIGTSGKGKFWKE